MDIISSDKVKSLENLFASRNKISEVNIEQPLQNLKQLDLANNNITDGSVINERCSNLEKLDLSANRINHLGVNSLAKMAKLESLNLSNNTLTKIRLGTLSYQQNLKILNFSHNKLNKINFDLFLPHLEQLTQLHLSDNQLKHLYSW